MKKRFLFAAFLNLFLLGCSGKFLDLAPVSEASTANFYQTASDFNNALASAYASLQLNGQYGQYYAVSEIPSDDSRPVLSGSVIDQDEFDKFYLRSTNPYLNTRWADGYKGIYRTNVILSRIDAISMNADLKKQYIGESKFLRALMYFNLVRIFGDVPLILEEIVDTEDGYRYNRTPAAEVYAQIIKDLGEAELALPATYTSSDLGRATRGAAQALLGNVYLTQHRYAEAASKLKLVVDSGIYALLPKYADVFSPANKNGKESVFEVQYKKGLSPLKGNGLGSTYAPANSGNSVIQFGGDGNNEPTADMVQAYEPGDNRKDVSLGTFYINSIGQRIDQNFIRKYDDAPTVKYDSDDNFPVLRYADVLLMYAEALNEAGNVPDALTLLNMVRARAGISNKQISSKEDMRLALEQERRVELAFEGHRWFDLVRTGRALPILNAKASAIGITTKLTEKNLVFPVPQSQIDINPALIKQNEGY
ncbi:RagB/SusD family nutrient uptake outer membrane protein [Dyadobacter sp. CY343]|uniref:RagB/SusD family nutrient uptake outer membrane protein n=1 Tax=Dyadobacter sp. CY343 TaxID=2907299 RepID=UPI001F2316AA|nr:RagB/SusD family nutrient uptake outer membrane protein [Dyadobacter sp. CY343]MCE7063392.1 RagB/SusD family nutrient uptake outer membrane protein [Dyadobacter sp. CY343]